MAFLKRLHKWIGVLIGVQVLLWLLSGLVFSLLDPEKVSGRQWAADVPRQPVDPLWGDFLEPGELPPQHLNEVLRLELTSVRGQLVYQVEHADGKTLLDAIDGTTIVTDEAAARQLALADFTGDGEIVAVEAGVAPDRETRDSAGAYWRVSFSDNANTALYISQATGEVLARRNTYWRVRDLFWMLHIMDYEGRENFNNSLIITVVLIAIWLGLSGFLLLFLSFGRQDFYFLKFPGRHEEVVVTLLDPAVTAARQVRLRKGSNLFLSLATYGVNLPSVCGGGGECGKCRVRIETPDLPAANTIEQGLIPRRMRERGFRLACQHQVENDISLELAAGSLADHDRSTG